MRACQPPRRRQPTLSTHERGNQGRVRRIREGSQPRSARAARSGEGARPAPLLSAADLGGGAGGRDGGARDDHARLQQLPGPDRRRAGQAGGPRCPRGVRHRRHRIAPVERDHSTAPRARARAGGVDGRGGRDRLHDRLPGQRRVHRRDPGAGRHRDLRLRRPRLDPRRLPPLRGEASTVPPQPDGQAGEDAGPRRRGRRRRPRRRRRSLLDGGRRLRPAADGRALPGPWGTALGRRGARRRRPRPTRGRRLRALRPRGRGRPPDGHLLEEPRLLRRLHRRPRGRGRVPEDLVALIRLQRLGRPGRGRGGAGGAAG